MVPFIFSAHLSHIQSQEKTQQNREMEANLRRRKELGEQQLAQKVITSLGISFVLEDMHFSEHFFFFIS